MWRTKQTVKLRFLSGLCLLLVAAMAPSVQAATCSTNSNQQSCSATYGVNEVFFGSGGDLNECSASYCSKVSAGELGVGNTASNNYQAQAGFNTDRYPSLTFVVPSQSVNAGILSVSSTKYATATFSVLAYLTSGYVVQTAGTPPVNGSHVLAPMTSGGASAAGTEQFGINLTANTSPASFGAAPSQSPDATFGFGAAASGYGSSNVYKYNSGDVIAQSLKSSGTTNYTISYIFNISNLTPGGTYSTNQVLVATATY